MTIKTTHTLANTNGDVYLLADGRGNHIAALHAVSHFAAQAEATRKLIERGQYNPNGEWTQPRQGCSRYRIETGAYRYTMTMTNKAGDTVTKERTAADEMEAIRVMERAGFTNVRITEWYSL